MPNRNLWFGGNSGRKGRLIENILNAIGIDGAENQCYIETGNEASQYAPHWSYYGALEFDKIVPIKFGGHGEIIVGNPADVKLYRQDWKNLRGNRITGDLRVVPSEKYDIVLFWGKEPKFFCKPNSGGGYHLQGYLVNPTQPSETGEYPPTFVK